MGAHSGFLRSKIFPVDDIDLSKIDKWLAQLEAKQLIRLYEDGGKDRLQILKWFDFQMGYVYLMYHDEDIYKIGFAGDPRRRVYQIKRETGRSCKILFMIKTPHYRSIEAELHRYFAQKRLAGEWFRTKYDDDGKISNDG